MQLNNSRVIRKHQGVTLIELLVVITIMMTMMSLVAPLAMNTIDKAEAQSEFLSFCGTLRRASVKAFVNGSGIKMTLDKNTLTAWQVNEDIGLVADDEFIEPQVLFEREYKYLTFSTTNLNFNKNGIANLVSINLTQLKRKRALDLIALLEN